MLLLSVQQSLDLFEFTVPRKGRINRIRTNRDRIHVVKGPNFKLFTSIEIENQMSEVKEPKISRTIEHFEKIQGEV